MKYLMLSSLFVLLNGCGEVYIPDPIELRIAKYSEEGNEVAGAIVNGDSWKTSNGCSTFGGCDTPPMHIYAFPDSDSLVITFLGRLQDGVSQGNALDLQFVLKGNAIEDFWDLRQLNGQLFVINDKDVWARIGHFDPYLDEGIAQTPCKRGQILYRKARHVVSENQGSSPRFILAGTFGLECEQSGVLTTVYKGRFDFSLEKGEVFFSDETQF